jgi:UDP-N-acetyl-D-mannosaminuronic acid dehydrogenase
MIQQKVCVIGLGYIGLPTATFIANAGFKVSGIDINKRAVKIINEGGIHIIEPGLEALVAKAVAAGNLVAYNQIQEADIYMICVPTPFIDAADSVEADMSYVFQAVDAIAGILKSGDLIILESTSPVGTTDSIKNYLVQKGFEPDTFGVGYCPERVLPGRIIDEFIKNDRIIGGNSKATTQLICDFYETFTECAIHKTSAKTAEMCKLTENSFRDVNIAFANELSMLCDLDGIDVWELIKLANYHPRVNVLSPGAGVGGHCISVDPWFIVAKHPSDARLIKTARQVNDAKPHWVIKNILSHAGSIEKSLGRSPTLAIYGLAFKPDIDDLRESPALEVARFLNDSKFNIKAVEPNITELEGIELVPFDWAIQNADVHIVLVAHKDFTTKNNSDLLRMNNALDYCGCLSS